MKSVKIKFCGMRRIEDIAYANKTLPDHAGFILSPGFKRSAGDIFPTLAKALDRKIKRVGVFVNEKEENILTLSPMLDVIQLHGDETDEYISSLRGSFEGEIWKAARLKSEADIEALSKLKADRYVLDAFSDESYGGTGKRIDRNLLEKAAQELEKPFFIAGGIDAGNIAETARDFKPYGIDISSGTETDGVKDLSKMEEIIRILREEKLR